MRNERVLNHFSLVNIGENRLFPTAELMVTLRRLVPSLDLCLLSAQFHG